MNLIKYVIINIIGTLLRGFPIPCKTGLVRVGNPGRDSPVFLTCNYILTVERVKKALERIDSYLLIANSRGINVWCASTGGYLNNHSVISVLKTSGIEELVDHRRIILPQLAATGIEAKVIEKKTGWNIIWGPVYAKDIPRFIENMYRKSPDMREVNFNLTQRVEIATMWAFPFSMIVDLLTIFIWPMITLSLTLLIWILSSLTFIPFPLYSRWIEFKESRLGISRYTIFFDLSSNLLILWGIFITLLITYELLNGFNLETVYRWSFISFIIILFLSIDLMGSTPTYKSGLHEERLLEVNIDSEKCVGCEICEQVCPRNCYDINKDLYIAEIARGYKCVKCGACIVQCPSDALYFKDPAGNIISPETIRKFKLNLMGKRLIKLPG